MKTDSCPIARWRLPTTATALAALAMSLAATTAGAASLSVSVATGVNYDPPGTTSGYSTSLAADLGTAHMVSSSASAYGSTTSGWAEAGAGLIRMYGAASVVNPIANGLPPGTDSRITAQANELSIITETVQVTSTTLAVGAPVDLLFGLSFSQSLTASESLSSFLDGGFEANFIASDQSPNPSLILDSMGLTSAVMHTFIGQTLSLRESMFGGAFATYIDQTAKTLVADATHSAHFYIDAQTAGVTLLAESGHNYSSAAIAPVPEPSELALLVAGLGLIGGVRNWRRGAAA